MDKDMLMFRKTGTNLLFSLWLAGFLSLPCTPAFSSDSPAASLPVATDSRIKTFIYSENDVFDIVTHYGYQCNVEFGKNEEIQTVSVGDRVSFQIIPAGQRLFIRAMTTNARTNMTVVTNKHAYQFDLTSVPTPVMPNEELVYVVRFFYPGDHKNDELPLASNPSIMTAAKIYNYKYTYTGSDQIAPLKIFDDGSATYFKLPAPVGGTEPNVYAVDEAGREVSLASHTNGEYLVVNTTSPRFNIREGDYMVSVYNEKLFHNN